MTSACPPPPETSACPASRPPAWAIAHVCLFITVLQQAPEWAGRYTFDVDESCIVQPAVRAWLGKGYTTNAQDALDDVARPTEVYPTQFPPGWGLIFLALLAVAGSPESALAMLKIVKAVAVFGGSWGWLALAARVLNPAGLAVFALGLCSMYFVIGGNPTHLVTWACIPWHVSVLLTGIATGRVAAFLLAGVFAVVAISMRHSSIFLIPSSVMCVLLFRSGPWRDKLTCAAAAAGPAVAAMAAIWGTGFVLSGRIGGEEQTTGHFTIDNVLRRNLLTFFFAFGFNLEEAIFKVRPSWRRDIPFAAFLPWYALLAAVAGWARLTGRLELAGERGRFLGAAFVTAASLATLLAVAAAQTPPMYFWNALEWPRYWCEVLPVVAIVWIMILVAAAQPVAAGFVAPQRVRAPVASFLAAAILLVAVGIEIRYVVRTAIDSVRGTWRAAAKPPPDEELHAIIAARVAAHPGMPHVVIDSASGCIQNLHWNDRVRGFFLCDLDRLPKTSSSAPVNVIVVVRWEGKSRDNKREHWDNTSKAEAFRDFFRLRPIGEAVDGEYWCEVFAEVVAPYKPGEKPRPANEEPRTK